MEIIFFVAYNVKKYFSTVESFASCILNHAGIILLDEVMGNLNNTNDTRALAVNNWFGYEQDVWHL